ncbi:hypothetical protein GCM10009727_29420 [Actinomadura napierensis]|uniref:Uncharacterized protein n=1 Tax=Actinomadura napierensis TaxID=267854 RepID=A0ABN2Z144_9ACTN
MQDERERRGGDPGGDVGGGREVRHLRQAAAAGLLGGLSGGGAPPPERLLPPFRAPLGDAPGRRPRDDPVDAGLGHGLHRQLAPVALRQRLDDHEPRRGRRLDPAGQHVQGEGRAVGGGDDALGEQPGTVGQVDALARPQPAQLRGVPALGAVQHDPVGAQPARVGEEHRRTHPTPPGPPPARPPEAGGAPSRPSR